MEFSCILSATSHTYIFFIEEMYEKQEKISDGEL